MSGVLAGAQPAFVRAERDSGRAGRRSSQRRDWASQLRDRSLDAGMYTAPQEQFMRRHTLAFLLTVAVTAPASAHHSAARFDLTQSVAVHGVVSRYEWANPHVYIYVTETDAEGESVEWEIEGQPPAMMRRVGWSPETLAIGDSIRLTGSPSRNPSSKTLLLSTMHKAEAALFDPQALRAAMSGDGRSGDTTATPSAGGLDGVWVTVANFPVTVGFARPAGRFQLTATAAAQLAAFDEATMSPAIDCIPLPAPAATIVPDVKRVSVENGSIRIAGEFDGGVRVIHVMDAAATPDSRAPQPSLQGHSIGRWEGKTLVVETTAFAPHMFGHGLGLKSSPAKRLVERFTLDADGTGLAYEFELTDAEVLSAPVTGTLRWAYRPDLKFAPEPCDRENARRFLN